MIRTRLAMWATAVSFAVPTLYNPSHVGAQPAGVPAAGAATAGGQTALPATITASPNADKTPEREIVQKYVQEQVEKLKAEDSAARTSARDALISRVGGGGGATTAHPVFIDFFSGEINTEIKKALADPKLETRLNAAIVVARIAPSDKAAKLSEAAVVALGDQQAPVVLWGMKAAAQLLPNALIVQPKNNPLLAKISEVGLARAGTTTVVEAYDALTLTSESTDSTLLRDRIKEAEWKKLVPLLLPELNKLWAARLDLYATGKIAEPMAEVIPAVFISQQRSWSALTPEQQAATMQMLHDQLSLAGELASAGLPEKAAYTRVVQRTASAIQVIAQQENNKALGDAASAAVKVQENTPGPAIGAATTQVLAAIKAAPKFAATKPPPKVKN